MSPSMQPRMTTAGFHGRKAVLDLLYFETRGSSVISRDLNFRKDESLARQKDVYRRSGGCACVALGCSVFGVAGR